MQDLIKALNEVVKIIDNFFMSKCGEADLIIIEKPMVIELNEVNTSYF